MLAPTLRVHNDFVTMTFALPDSLVRFKKGGVSTETLGKSSEKSSEKILRYLRQESTLSAKALAEKMHLSPRAIEKQIDLLKKDGKLIRIGPAKGGHWQVVG
jgi:predicted HTH transcriptional regulator